MTENYAEKVLINYKVINSPDDIINCKEIAKLLYEAFLLKFKIELNPETAEIFYEYQNRIYDLLDYMREETDENIKKILHFIDTEIPCVCDIIIMSWSLSRPGETYSKKGSTSLYKNNIEKFNKKLINIVDFFVIKNFCKETLSKNCSVPIHCMDILWHYMVGMGVEFIFIGDQDRDYVGIIIDEEESGDTEEFIYIKINIEHILKMGIGSDINNHPAKISFKQYLKVFITNEQIAESIIALHNKNSENYLKQMSKIIEKTISYFDEEVTPCNILMKEIPRLKQKIF